MGRQPCASDDFIVHYPPRVYSPGASGCSVRVVAAPDPHALPTSLVGSYAQPDWLIDRERLARAFPPRVRATELWRVDPAVPRAGAGRRDPARHPRPGARRARHHHGRRDAPRELLESLRDGARRASTSTTRAPRSTAAAIRTRCRAWSARSSASTRCRCATCSSCGRTRAGRSRSPCPARSRCRSRRRTTPTRARRSWRWRMPPPSTRRSRTSSQPAPTSCRSTSRTCRRGPRRHASSASRRSTRALEGVAGTTAVHICFGYAAIIHERPSGLLLPARAGRRAVRPDLDRDGPVGPRHLGPRDAAGQDDHPRRARPRRHDGRVARDRRRAHPPRLPAQAPDRARSRRRTAA